MHHYGRRHSNRFWGPSPFMMANPFKAYHHCHCNNMLDTIMQFSILNRMFSRRNQPVYTPVNQQYQMPYVPINLLLANDYNSNNNGAYATTYYNNGLYGTSTGTNLAELFNSSYNSVIGTSNSSNYFNTSSSSNVSVDNSPVGDYNDTGKLDENFLKRVKLMAQRLKCDYKDLLSLINSESGLNPQAGKSTGGAVGLTQFTQIAIDDLNMHEGLNLTKEKILAMSPIEQLDLAEKYMLRAKKNRFGDDKVLSGGDLYALNFLPARATREVLCTEGEKDSNGKLLGYYEQNSGLDLNGDKQITKSELAQRCEIKRVDESRFTLVA